MVEALGKIKKKYYVLIEYPSGKYLNEYRYREDAVKARKKTRNHQSQIQYIEERVELKKGDKK